MKKAVFIISIILVIILIVIVCGVFNQMKKAMPSSSFSSEIDKEIANMQGENSYIENEVEEQNITDNKIENVVENKNENTITKEILEDTPKTEEEKAIQIVEKDYGTAQNIKIAVEGMDEKGREIVVVRNSETTEAIAFYFVNVSNSTFDKKEMN